MVNGYMFEVLSYWRQLDAQSLDENIGPKTMLNSPTTLWFNLYETQ